MLGIVPVGSGNGLARHLNLPMRVRKALSLIKKGDYKTIDFGTINDQKFFCTSGVGFDAHIGDVFARSQGRGFVSYLKATLLEFKRYRPERYEISINGTTYLRDAFLITFANASQYGNNAHIAPKAQVDDGKLEVSVMKPFPWIAAPGMGIRLFAKNMDKSRYVETFRGEKIVVKRKKPGVIHYDGEPGKMGEILTVRLIPKGLRVIVS